MSDAAEYTGPTDLRDIVARLGGSVYAGGRCASIPGPGHGRRDRSLSLRMGDSGRVLFYSFAGDDARAVMQYLGIERVGRSDSRSSREEFARMKRAREDAKRKADAEALAFCETIWAGTVPIEGSPAERYLYSRGLIFEGTGEMRFHPAAPRSKPDSEHQLPPHAAMTALVRASDDSPRALHLTYLTPDGEKAFGSRSRLMFGPTAGATVHVCGRPDDGVLGLTEGIETAGAFSILTGLNVWAALSTSGLRNFEPPWWLKRLVIGADNDDRGAGIAAAEDLAGRLRRRCDVEVRAADEGQDWHDHYRSAA